MMQSTLTLSVADRLAQAEALAPEWRRLAERCEHARIFQSPDWCLAWWRVVAEDSGRHALAIVQVRDDTGELLGLAPLMVETNNGRRTLCFLSHPYADYHDVLYPRARRDAVLTTLWRAVVRECDDWDTLALTEIPTGSPTAAWLGREAAESEQGMSIAASVCPAIDLTDDAAVRRATDKYEYRSKARKLAATGPLTCTHLWDPHTVRYLFPEFRDMHLTQWEGREDVVGGFDDEAVTDFFVAIIDALASRGELVLTRLSVGERALAYYLGMLDRRHYRAYRTAFDVSLASYSPGGVLLRQMVLDFRAARYQSFDFMRGNYTYKRRFASTESRNMTFRLDRSALNGGVS